MAERVTVMWNLQASEIGVLLEDHSKFKNMLC